MKLYQEIMTTNIYYSGGNIRKLYIDQFEYLTTVQWLVSLFNRFFLLNVLKLVNKERLKMIRKFAKIQSSVSTLLGHIMGKGIGEFNTHEAY